MVSVKEAVESADIEAFGQALAEDVVWIGLLPGEVCRNREQVLGRLRQARDHGRRAAPEIVLDNADLLVVDPHFDGNERHQVFVLRDGLIAEMRAYPDRATAVAAATAVAS